MYVCINIFCLLNSRSTFECEKVDCDETVMFLSWWSAWVWIVSCIGPLSQNSTFTHHSIVSSNRSSVFRSLVSVIGTVSLTHSSRKSVDWKEHTKYLDEITTQRHSVCLLHTRKVYNNFRS